MSIRGRKWLLSIMVLASVTVSALKPVDHLSFELTDQALQNAAVTYATARLINGAISVLKGTEVGLAVGGTVTFAVGEILDPLHDLIEQLSLVLLIALTSLGIQKVFLLILASGLFNALLLALGLLLLAALWLSKVSAALKDALFRGFCLLLLARFSIVFIVLANQWVFDHYLQETYVDANSGLTLASIQLEQARLESQSTVELGEEESSFLGLWESVRNSLDPAQRVAAIRSAAEKTLQQSLDLITVFVLQTLLLPLLFALLLYKSARALGRLTCQTWI
jgi:hypothetical protein